MSQPATIATTDDRFERMMSTLRSPGFTEALVLPALGIALFLLAWQFAANRIDTSLGQFPGPVQVWEQMGNLAQEHQRERDKADAFFQRQEARNAAKLAENPDATITWRDYTGKDTYLDQIGTSLVTVAAGLFM